MSKLIILVGPSPSGKTTWAARKSLESGWRCAHNRANALGALDLGFNVVLEEEYANPGSTVASGFGSHEVEVKTFTYDKTFRESAK